MCRLAAILSLLLLVGLLPIGVGNDKGSFGLDWKAAAEYGGYHQAIATGMDAKHGLQVTIRHGGPQVNRTRLPLAGRLDFNMTGDGFLELNFIHRNIPFRPIAATFQKEPVRLIAHPDEGSDGFAELNRKPIMISPDTPVG
jgi:NitT/TauT family transport system substrate-binding protein